MSKALALTAHQAAPRGLGQVITLSQPGRRKPPSKEQVEVSAPDIYRAIGSLEAMASNLKQAVDGLMKAQAENNVLTAQIVAKLDSIGKDLHGASSTAQKALERADGAHDRLDRIVWTAAGGGAVAGILMPPFLGRAWEAGAAILKVMFGG